MPNSLVSKNYNPIYKEIKQVITSARKTAVKQVNTTLVKTYFEIGRLIVEWEQGGEDRAKYGKETIANLSEKLSTEFGKGFSVDNLENMRKFYLTYKKSETVSRKFTLSWSHYVFLMRLDPEERSFYEIEATENNWSLRELKRQFDSGLYDRLRLSSDKEKIRQLATKGQLVTKPKDAIKDPYILEFLGLDEKAEYSESDLEQSIIDRMEDFLLELGKGFAFVKRQQRITLTAYLNVSF